jgi:hypothetical protein
VSEYDREASIMRRPWPNWGFCTMVKKIVSHHYWPRGHRMTGFGNKIKMIRQEGSSRDKTCGIFPIVAWWFPGGGHYSIVSLVGVPEYANKAPPHSRH